MQLDIFNDNREVMLRNDVLQALQLHQAHQAQLAWVAMQGHAAGDAALAPLQTLISAQAALTTRLQAAVPVARFTEHAALQAQRLALLEEVMPAAQRMLGAAAAQWLRPFWQDLILRADSLPFQPQWEAEHAAPMCLHLQDWSGAVQAVEGIASWRRIPAPLAWMAQAQLHLTGLSTAWPLLAELAWLSPKRLETTIQTTNNVLLQHLKAQFDTSFEPAADQADAAQDAAWFPAWVLTQQPQNVAHLSLAQPGQHSAPEQAMRLLVNLLGLERQGRHHDIVNCRKNLRDLNGWLYAQYMSSR
ncbi:MAG: hypothetical protein PHQ58_05865 [Rhodoferax sp.]|uniref:hypothetical protein n=1 Tax=Rhodoferax sp. TaxID=50421 RepID=UPI00261258FF|nr:hypothetical protein [Rhodoferax sp.]MDD2879944.1 hypothetical protein [Rhodoferax sp.]